MKPAVFHDDAEAEFGEAVAYYEGRRAGLGLDFQSEVEALVLAIRHDPARWPSYKGTEFRKGKLGRFPYNVFYLDLEDRIWIAAVAHQKRRPGYWAGRTPG